MKAGLQRPDPLLVLASGSVARQRLLQAAGLQFEAFPASVDEGLIKQSARAEGAAIQEAALLVAEFKAKRVGLRFPEALIIGADQILDCQGAWFDKPGSLAEARAQLHALRSKTHQLATAVVCVQGGSRIWHQVVSPRLTMRRFSEDFLEAYIAAEAEFLVQSVGAYRIEGLGLQLFSEVEGDASAIQGLPLLALLGFLRQYGVLLE
ncbi:MAG: Maf-like protein [Acetobacteraceae bacterium]|nr:Maf-like protein [Acetobacteraceae bacterium]MBV8524614.1 Maf-like protein [Acetobacteraceae bacterium]